MKLKPIFFLSLLFLLSLALVNQHGIDAKVLASNASENTANGGNQDHTAKIVSLEGDVRSLKKGADNWQAAQKDQIIEAGDQLLTGKSSFADITYDPYLLNITRIQENTKAEFRTINPTDIYLEDGSIFSALDGLDSKGEYQIATPTAVAAVRGTHFDVAYDEQNKKFSAAALPTDDTTHQSKILVTDPWNPKTTPVEVTQNYQLDFKSGEILRSELIHHAEPARLQASRAVMKQMGEKMPQFKERREQGKIQFQERQKMAAEGQPHGNPPQTQTGKENGSPDRPQPGSQNSLMNHGQDHPQKNEFGQPQGRENKPQQQQSFGGGPQQQPRQGQGQFQGGGPGPARRR